MDVLVLQTNVMTQTSVSTVAHVVGTTWKIHLVYALTNMKARDVVSDQVLLFNIRQLNVYFRQHIVIIWVPNLPNYQQLMYRLYKQPRVPILSYFLKA